MSTKKQRQLAAAILGSAKTAAKARTARENGKKHKAKKKKVVLPIDAQARRWRKVE